MSQEVLVHSHMSLLSHQESGKEKVSHNSIPHPRRAFQAASYVLWSHQLPSHLPDDDELHLLNQGSTRMALSIHG
jgi:hypothetical protein